MRFSIRDYEWHEGEIILASRLHLAVLMLAALSPAANAGEVLPGPIPAKIVSVYDGDTITVMAHIWLGQDVETKVRLDGIDTPEIKGKCDAEKMAAVKARDFLAELAGDAVTLRDIHYGKYAGRVVASVPTESGMDLVAALIAAGHGRAYSGGKRRGWCP